MVVKLQLGSVPEQPGARARCVRYHIWAEDVEEDETLRDSNHAIELARQLAVGPHTVNGRPPLPYEDNGYKPLFLIWISVTNTRAKTSRYAIDRYRFPGCPARVSERAMEMYAALKSMIDEGVELLRTQKAEKASKNAK